jgi:putative hemolysin
MSIVQILGWESLVLLLLIVANGIFSMSEIALVSSRKPKLEQMAEAGDLKARRVLDLIADPGRFLATVQVGITLVGTLAGAYGGITIADRIAAELTRFPLLAEYSRVIAVFLVVVFVTYFQVVLGELVPKALALRHSESIARQVVGFMIGLSRAAAPVVQFLNLSTQGLLRLFGAKVEEGASVTEEEIGLMLAQGTREGVLHSSQQDMMESVIEMGERRITALMTPRPDIEWLDSEGDLEEIRAGLAEHPYSRFPVCRGSFDNILGVVHAKDLLARFLNGQSLDLEALAQPVPVIPDSLNVLKALEAFRVSGGTMAFVSDEYGSILGLVTLDDVLRNILGDALKLTHRGPASAPAHAGDEPDVVRRGVGAWLVDGTKPLIEVEELLDDSEAFTREDEENYRTLGGFVMGRLDRIPRAGDSLESAGWGYEVMDMDGHRVDKVLITKRMKNEE